MSASPQVVVLPYPFPAGVQCPRCWRGEDPEVWSRGDFCDPLHLAKHLKAKHPGDTITYKCSECDFRGYGASSVRPVKAHFKKEHAAPRGRAGRSTDGASNSNNGNVNYGGSSTDARGRPAAGSAPGSSASAGASSRGRPSDSRQPGLRSTAPAPGTTAATPPPRTTAATPPTTASTSATSPARTSPSYAAVTAASGPATAGAPAAATTGLKEHPHPKGRLSLKRGAANGKSSPPASREARGSPRRPSGEANGTLMRTSVTPPTTISSAGSYNPRRRRSSNVPLEKSGASRSMRGPPLPSPKVAREDPVKHHPGGASHQETGSGERIGREVRNGGEGTGQTIGQ
ncbi:hypothetical protein EAG_15096 [Camponotus floridanus]|uniref:Uncharacterized protein n=1 Tax=Camponotus floridanus TaxID=104421 RepID=E1ZUW9_CAMFO|nr:hypothetical protein EAG_15096 [Camponotus floridanus]